MVAITGNVTLFGLEILSFPLLQLIVFLCVVVLLFLFVLEIEFRQIKKLTKRFDDEDMVLSKDLRELRETVRELEDLLKSQGIELDDGRGEEESEGDMVRGRSEIERSAERPVEKKMEQNLDKGES